MRITNYEFLVYQGHPARVELRVFSPHVYLQVSPDELLIEDR